MQEFKVDEYLSDKEQAERIKQWWLENYKAIFAGIVIALLIIGGWRYWQHRVQTRAAAASALYNKLSDAVKANNGPDALKLTNSLMNEYSDTPYAAQGALVMGGYDVDNGKSDDAVKMLTWATAHSKDQSLALLARLRLARVQLANGDGKAAIKTLTVENTGGFTPLYDDVRGDAYAKLGDTDKARKAYKQALAKWDDKMGDKSLIQMKLNNLAATPAAKPTKGDSAK